MKRLTLLLIVILISLNIVGCNTNKTKPIINNDPIDVESPLESVDDNKLNKYDINVELNQTEKLLIGEAKISYINNENLGLDKIYFHIYPNAYKREETSPVPLEDFEVVYRGVFKPGFIDITSISSNNEELLYNIEGTDETILGITPEATLKPGERIEILIAFKITLPPVDDRLGYGDDCYNFGNWYPIAAVYDDSGWNLDPYYAMGDPFYSDISDYKVNIKVPEEFIVAATGVALEEKVLENKKTYSFEEKSIRDFAWVASDKFHVDVDNVDGIKIKNYYLGGSKARNEYAMTVAKNSIKIFNKMYGKYPYKTISIVATQFISGMEYPGIVFINKDYYYNSSDQFYLEVTIAHEVAHQWWYNAVGNDEVDEAWVDESLAAYSEVVYYENTNSKEYGASYMRSEYTEVYNNYKNNIQVGERILQPVYEFNNLNDYAVLVYYKGAMLHDAIREEVGDEIFFKILQTYYDEYKFKNATSQDYIDVVEEVTGKAWDVFFNEWL
ncbi:MAG: family metallopeptidase [Clostridiales bacterium]|jgi:hypothetical protein|nr:family metallopeptidase [Clostridiales bacterium]